MNRLLPIPLVAAGLMLLVSCGSPYRYVKTRSVTEAQLLKADLTSRKFSGADMDSANAILERAEKFTLEGKDKEASQNADLAAARYRLALARHELSLSQVDLSEAKVALKTAEQQVKTYEKILNGIRESRNP